MHLPSRLSSELKSEPLDDVNVLAEMLHPLVRTDEAEIAMLLKSFNEVLRSVGYELHPHDWTLIGHELPFWYLCGC